MKKLILICIALVALCFSENLVAQEDWSLKVKADEKVYTDITEREKDMINEVYGDRAKDLVWNAKNNNLKNGLIRLIRERIEIIDSSKFKKQKQTQSLFDKGLASKFNKNLKLDNKIDLKNFNPLKYNLDFFSNGTYLYKIDGTNSYIQITSQYRIK
jgi:hypothetical protein